MLRLLLKYCKEFSKLHQEQIETWKHRCAIYTVASLVHKDQESRAEKKLMAVLFMDVNKVFDHISRTKLV